LIGNNETAPVFPQPVHNVKSALQYLRKEAKQLGIDPDQIVLQGSSAGATLIAQVLVSANDPYYQGNELWQNIFDRPNGVIDFYGYYAGLTRRSDSYFGGQLNSSDPAVQQRIAKANAIPEMLKVDIKLYTSRHKSLWQEIIAPMDDGTSLPKF
jgi:acetyl esterase/lipase